MTIGTARATEPGRIDLPEIPALAFPPTACRARVDRLEPTLFLVPDGIVSHIAEHGLYLGDMTSPGSLPPQRRRVGVLPIAVIAGALVLGTATGVVVHQVGQVTASPPAASSTTAVAQSPSSSVAPADPSDSPAKSPDPNETPSTGAPPGLPRSAPLDDAQFVVPRGLAEVQQLDVAWFNGPTATRRLKTPKGDRVNSPTLSVDRRTVIYIDRTANRLRTIAADGSGDRVLFNKHPPGCATIGHVSWNRADQNQLAMRCIDEAGRAGLFVVTSG